MSIILIVLTSIFFIVTVLGLINSKFVLKGGNRDSRKKVIKIYGSIFLILLLMSLINIYATRNIATVDNYIQQARISIKENKDYETAVKNYKKALDKWEEGEEYIVNKEKLIKEFRKALEILTYRIDAETFGDINPPEAHFHPEF
jgi:hypothetical protein